MTAPFLFEWPGFEASEGEPIDVDGEVWRRLNVRFPRASTPTAASSVISSHANAAHLSDGHREFDGLVFPTSRRVVPKAPGGRLLPGPTRLPGVGLDQRQLGGYQRVQEFGRKKARIARRRHPGHRCNGSTGVPQ